MHLIVILPYKVKTQYVHILHFLIFWVMQHFAHTAFLLFFGYIYIFLNKQRVIMIIILNPYQNIFQMTLNFYRASDDILLLMHFAHTAFLLCHTFFPKIHSLKIFFKNCYYHLICKKPKMAKMSHILHLYFVGQFNCPRNSKMAMKF